MAAAENRPGSPMSGCVHGKDRINQCLRGLVCGDAPFCKTQHGRERVLKLMDTAKARRSASGHDRCSAGSERRIEGNADRRVRIAALHGQIEIDDDVAGRWYLSRSSMQMPMIRSVT